MAEIEQLSLYSEYDYADEVFYVRNHPSPGVRTSETIAVETVSSAGWRLTATAPTRAHQLGHNISRLLHFERHLATRPDPITGRAIRVHHQDGSTDLLHAIPHTDIGQVVSSSLGLRLKFLGVTRMVKGAPDTRQLGAATFVQDARAPMTGMISINGMSSTSLEAAVDDIFGQFILGNLDGSYRDDVHEPESISLGACGLMVGMPFGKAPLQTEVPFRPSRFEYVVFRGADRLCTAAELLIRFRFEVKPR
jgi:hypothetical protein